MPVTNLHRRSIMQAAHRTRRALGLSMAEALKAAWAAFRRALRNRWPTHHITMPHEQTPPPAACVSSRRSFTRASGRLAWSFAA
jgi:hypothetical protein